MNRYRSLFSSLLIAATLVGTTACDTGPKPGEEAVYYAERLKSDDATKRAQALKELIHLKDARSLAGVHGLLASGELELRGEAADLLGQIADVSSIDPLINAIDWKAGSGKNKKTRMAANANERIAKALGQVGEKAPAKVIATLKKLADTNHLNTQLAAIVALGRLKATDAVDQLVLIADGSNNNFIVKKTVVALGQIQDPRAVPVLAKLLFFERDGVSFYREASWAMFKIGKPAVETLVKTFHGKNTDLENMNLKPAVMQAKVLQILTDLGAPEVKDLALAVADSKVYDAFTGAARANAHTALGRLGFKDGKKVLLKHWDNVDITQSEFALTALVEMGAKDVVPALIKMSTHDGFMNQCVKVQDNPEARCKVSNPQVRRQRLKALSRLAGGKDLAAFDAIIKDMSKLDNVEGVPPKFAAKLKAEGQKLKADLEKARARIAAAKECDGKGNACWASKLKDKNPMVRERAAYELMWAGAADQLDAVAGNLQDEDNEARFAAILAVWRLMPKTPNVKLADKAAKILAEEKGKTQFIRINEDLKRLEVKLRRGF